MPRLYIDKEQRRLLTEKFSLSPATLHEIIHFQRPECQRHAEIRNYAVNELGVKVLDI